MPASQILDSTSAIIVPSRVRLGVICDLVEEHWPSMDLVGDMLLAKFAELDTRLSRIEAHLNLR